MESALITGALALVGVVVGALLTHWGNAQQSRHARSTAVGDRMFATRLDAYAAFLTHANALYLWCANTGARRSRHNDDGIEWDHVVAATEPFRDGLAVHQDLIKAVERIRLLGDDGVRAAAKSGQVALIQGLNDQVPVPDWPALRRAFEEAAGRALGQGSTE